LALLLLVVAWLLTPSRGFVAERALAPSRRALIAGTLTMGGPAGAVLPPGIDSRGLSDISVMEKQFAGDVSSDVVKSALASLRRLEAEVRQLQAGYEANTFADPSPVIMTDVKGLRANLATLAEVGDSRTQQDLERVGRLLMVAWYQMKNDPDIRGVGGADLALQPTKKESDIETIERILSSGKAKQEIDEKKTAAIQRLQGAAQMYLAASEKMLQFFA